MADADAELKSSQARINDAEAERIKAETAALKAETSAKKKLLKKMLDAGIDFSSEQQDAILRIAVTKKKKDDFG